MYRHDILNEVVVTSRNDMQNVFDQKWKEKEVAGEVADTQEFLKPFSKAVAKEMLKAGWTKSVLKEALDAGSEFNGEDLALMRMHLYSQMADARSWLMSNYLLEGKLSDKAKSMAFEEVAKTFRKQYLFPVDKVVAEA